MDNLPVARTAGVIANETGASLTQVSYILRTRDHIKPIGRAGKLYLYGESAVRMVRHELNAISAKRPDRRAAANV